MNVLVKQYTGFQSVKHNIQFQPETPKKAKALAESGHVQNVSEYDRSIQASVIRETSVLQKPYETKLLMNGERLVTTVSCTCTYNKSNTCKHVAALIYFINTDQSATKTSHEKQWRIPSARQFALAKYSKGKSCELMFKVKNVATSVSTAPPINLSDLRSNSALKIIMIADGMDKTELAVKSIISSLLDNVERNLELDSAKNNIKKMMDTFFSLANKAEVYHCTFVPEAELQTFFDKYIKKSDQEIVQLCSETVKQSSCKKWFDEWRLRFTASSNVHNINVRRTKPVDKLVQEILNPSKVNTEATRYGIVNEPKARKLYGSLFDCEVLPVGINESVVVCKFRWMVLY